MVRAHNGEGARHMAGIHGDAEGAHEDAEGDEVADETNELQTIQNMLGEGMLMQVLAPRRFSPLASPTAQSATFALPPAPPAALGPHAA